MKDFKQLSTSTKAARMAKIGASLERVTISAYVEQAISERLKANHPATHQEFESAPEVKA